MSLLNNANTTTGVNPFTGAPLNAGNAISGPLANNPVSSTSPTPNPTVTPPVLNKSVDEAKKEKEVAKKPVSTSKIVSYILSISSLLVVIALIGASFYAGYLAYQEYLRIDILKAQEAEKTQTLSKVTAHANYLKSLVSLKDKLDTNMVLSEQAITISHEIPQIMNQFLKIGETNNLEVKGLVFAGSTTESTGTKLPGTINMQIDLLGGFSDITNFLSNLEQTRRLDAIKGFKYVSKLEEGQKQEGKFIPNEFLNGNNYQLVLVIAGFYLGEVDATNLDYELLVNQQKSLDRVIPKLESMIWYEPSGDIENLQIGTTDPFNPNKKFDGISPLISPTTPTAP